MDVFELQAVIKLTLDQYKRDLAEAETETRNSGVKVGGILKSVAQAGVAALGASITAVGALSKQVVDAYGNYEQLVGGVEKLFGADAGQRIIENAEKAFQTAGLSANEYMETVTSFSASLISSLEGDTQKAVDYADMALRDMSDNANTFGTDIASIQYAYQGFAKANYTMLDNLKLGYGGTKTEMERLIADANDLKVAQGGVADLTIERYADIVEAIHLVQEEMNIAGTTSREAASTIEGSINSLKGSLKNLWTAFGSGNADVRKQTREVIDNFKTLLRNVRPVIKRIAKALPDALREAIKQLPRILPEITDMFNDIVDTGFTVIKGFISALPSILSQIPDIVGNIAEGIFDLINNIDFGGLIISIVETAGGIIGTLYEKIIANNDESMASWYAHRDAIIAFREAGQEAYEQALALNEQRAESYTNIEAEIGILEDVRNKLSEYVDEQGYVKEGYADEVEALEALAEKYGVHFDVVDGQIQHYQDLETEIDALIQKRKEDAIVAAETSLYEEAYKKRRELDSQYQTHYNNYIDAITQADLALAEGRTEDEAKYRALATEQLAAAESLKDGMVEYSAQMELANYNMVTAASGNFEDLASTYDQAGIDIEGFYDDIDSTNKKIIKDYEQTYHVDIPDNIEEGNYKAQGILTSQLKAQQMLLEAGLDDVAVASKLGWTEAGEQGIAGLVHAFDAGQSEVINSAAHVMASAIASAKAEAGIKSPSRVFREIGENLTRGLAIGIDDGATEAVDAAIAMVNDINSSMDALSNDIDVGFDDSLNGLAVGRDGSQTEYLLSNLASKFDNFEEYMYNAISRVLSEGFDLRFNDRELTRLVKEHA